MVIVRGGTYFLSEPLVFGPQDSGTARNPITYRAAPGEKVVLSGGTPVAGWKVAGKLWQTTVPGVRDGAMPPFSQLWGKDGARRFRARTPNRLADPNREENFFHVAKPGYGGPTQLKEPLKTFGYAPGDIDPSWDLRGAEVVMLQFWMDFHLPVKSIDAATRTVSVEKGTRFKTGTPGEARGARYFVENFREALDAPGEWFLDPKTGVLSYFPLPGETIQDTVLIAPRLPVTLQFNGDPNRNRPVSHLRFENLTFSHNEWQLPQQFSDGKQSMQRAPGLVIARGLQNSAFENCTFANYANHGLQLLGGSSGNRIARCSFTDGGAGGPHLNGAELNGPAALRTRDNVIEDCRLSQLGQIFPSASGIFVQNSGGNRVLHNTLHDLPYSGISVGLNFDFVPSVSQNNIVENNHLREVVRLMHDGGAIYTQGQMRGTVIKNNLVHDVGAGTLGVGIYLDGSTADVTVENNLIYRASNFAFHQSRAGRTQPKNNLVRNNIFALSGEKEVQLADAEQGFAAFRLERNILLAEKDAIYGAGHASSVAQPRFLTASNLLWSLNGPPIIARDGARPWEKNQSLDALSFSQWQTLGQDQGSLVADPLFKDARNGDFSLAAASPASKIGFVPFDVSGVGARPSPR